MIDFFIYKYLRLIFTLPNQVFNDEIYLLKLNQIWKNNKYNKCKLSKENFVRVSFWMHHLMLLPVVSKKEILAYLRKDNNTFAETWKNLTGKSVKVLPDRYILTGGFQQYKDTNPISLHKNVNSARRQILHQFTTFVWFDYRNFLIPRDFFLKCKEFATLENEVNAMDVIATFNNCFKECLLYAFFDKYSAETFNDCVVRCSSSNVYNFSLVYKREKKFTT